MTEVRNLSPLPRPIRMEIDPNEQFILNKPGTFSELSRKCQISEKGLMEYEDGKQKKLKEVRDVVNKIEREGDKDNDNKIKWIAQPKKYPFRVVLLDRNDSHKALYFSSLERA